MKLIDPRGRPSASMVNRLIDAVDSSNSTITTLGPGGAPFDVYKALGHDIGYDMSDYALRCDIPSGIPAINGWHIKKGSVKKKGLRRASVWYIYSIAHQHRIHYMVPNPYFLGVEHVTYDSYGLVRLHETVASDMMLSGVSNTLGVVGGYKATGGINPDTGLLAFEIGEWYGDVDPTGDLVVLAEYTDSDGIVHPENWIAGGHNGGNPCPANVGQQIRAFADWTPSAGGAPVGVGPGWQAIYVGNAMFSDWPHHPLPILQYGFAGNFIGVLPGGMGEPGTPQPGSTTTLLKCYVGNTFGFNELMASIPTDGQITDAKLTIKIGGIQYGHGSYADTVEYDSHGNPSLGTPVGDYQITDSAQGIIVLGTRVPAPLSREWEILGSVSASVKADEWTVADVTGLIQGLIDNHANSPYTHFAFAPAISAQALAVMHEGAGEYLDGISWQVTWGAISQPLNAGEWQDGSMPDGTFGGADLEYIVDSSFSHISWDNVEVGQIAMTWKYPDSEYGREAISTHLCPAH